MADGSSVFYEPIIIKGGGSVATGVAHRLFRSNYHVVLTELPQPTTVRRTAAFAEAVYSGTATVEGVTARHYPWPVSLKKIHDALRAGEIPVISRAPDPEPGPESDDWLYELTPAALIDAVSARKNTGTFRRPGVVTLALGPGFSAGPAPDELADAECGERMVDAVIETACGRWLGRVILEGAAEAEDEPTGKTRVHGLTHPFYAPAAGVLEFNAALGDMVKAGEPIGLIRDAQANEVTIRAPESGLLLGLARSTLATPKGAVIGIVDPEGRPEYCSMIPARALAIGGGVLEALLMFGVLPDI